MGQRLKGKLLSPPNNFNNPQEMEFLRAGIGFYINLFDFNPPAFIDPSVALDAGHAVFTQSPLFIPHLVQQGAPGVSAWNFSLQLSCSTTSVSSAFTMQPAIAIIPVSVQDDIDETQGAQMTVYNRGGVASVGVITEDFGQTQEAPSTDVSFFYSGINVSGGANCAALNHPFLLGFFNNNATGQAGDQLNIDRARIFIKFPSSK